MPNPLTELSIDDLRRHSSRKWRYYPEDVLPLWVAEIDAPVAEPIVRAVTDALRIGDAGYPFGAEYAQALSDYGTDRWGWGFDPAASMTMPDVMNGMVLLLRQITDAGDVVVVNPPVYPPFYAFTVNAGRRIVEAPLTAEFRLDPDALDRAFAEARAGGRPAVWLLGNPHNPTGTVHTRDELATGVDVARRHGVRIIADEIHAPLILPGATFVPILTVPGAESAFSLLSASKGWGLAGLKAALAVAGEAAADDIAALPPEVAFAASQIGLLAQTVALREARPWLDDLVVALDANRRLLGDLLAERLPTVGYRPPEATYLTWLDCRALGLGDDPSVAFLERGRVAVNAGPTFGSGGAGHVRLNIATSPAILTEAVSRMASVVATTAV